MNKRIWLSLAHMGGREQDFIKEAFDTNWVVPLGPNVDAFEQSLVEYLHEDRHVVALSAGTAALHLGLILLDVKPGDEVICQSFTFAASANPISYLEAKPVFVDSEKDTWNMDPVLLEEAVLNNMDNFASQLQAHFDDLQTNGREVNVEILVFDNGSGKNLETEFDGEMLTDIIDGWMYNNTQEHRYNVSDATENRMLLEQVRIPLYRENGMPMDTRSFANNLRRYLRAAPYNVECKLLTKGLGKAILVIGEK